ncbi:hypothetical protein [Cyclobacterium jeungdonense]|uniref:Uncharacterized protein n=1 Tax=Cyclobacterium jeungdonense TaxID=708087 RepID=A0ABT8C255_9BACT|nr:hypothetical protein [Cyclobacterium jeungdonense]MDN3686875.1 hypothetical protein [Cyclobacterium jeungdonense]
MVEILDGFQLPGKVVFFTWMTLMTIAILSIYLHLNPERLYGFQTSHAMENRLNVPPNTDLAVKDIASPENELATIRRD